MSHRLFKLPCLALAKSIAATSHSIGGSNCNKFRHLKDSYAYVSRGFSSSSRVKFSASLPGGTGNAAVPSNGNQDQQNPNLESQASSDSGDAFKRLTQYPTQAAIAMMFTCAKCETRSVRTFSRHSYEKGLVLVRCPGCRSLHLIADHLGWFDDEKNFTIEKYLNETGQKYHKASVDDRGDTHVVEVSGRSSSSGSTSKPESTASAGEGSQATVRLTMEDLAGWTKVQRLLKEISHPAGGAAADEAAATGGTKSSHETDHHGHHDHHHHHHDHDHDHEHGHKCGGGGGCGGSGGCGGGGCGGSGGCGGGGGCGSHKHDSDASSSSSDAMKAATAPLDESTLEVSPEDLELWAKVQHRVKEAVNENREQ